MNKLILISILVLISTFATNAQGINNVPNPAKTETNVFVKSEIQINGNEESFNPKIVAGNLWVLQYDHRFEEYPDVTDDERSESLLFQIPQQRESSFLLSGAEQITSAKVIYNKSCFCPDGGYFKITEGRISGIKLNDTTWEINANFMVPAKGELSVGPKQRNLTAIFYVKQALVPQETISQLTPSKTKAEILTKSKLKFKNDQGGNIYPHISKGRMWVFGYNYQAPENPNIADDEYREEFLFQIKKPQSTTFEITDISAANAIFEKSCFCADRGYYKITEGKITGNKIDDKTWEVTASFSIPVKGEFSAGEKQKIFTARFLVRLSNHRFD